MNIFHKTAAAVCLAALALAATGCDKDGDTIYTDGADKAELNSPASEIVLSKDNLQALALTLYWNENGDISLSDPEVAAPSNAASNTIQFSSDAAFATVVEDAVEAGVYYRQYTCEALNVLVGRIGLEGGVRGTVYIRIKTVLGANIEPVYSDVLVLNVTPYFIDMSTGFVLDASHNDTGRTLASPALDGVYSGFIGAGAWENWWLREGNNTERGNAGVTGTPVVMGNSTTGLEIWNFWYPGMSGCYYTVVNTGLNEWSALFIPALTLGGDLQGEMTYDRKSNKWSYTFDAQAKTYSVTISGTGKQYDRNTGTDDAAATDTPVGFGGSADALTLGSSATAVSFNVAAAGETTLTLDLNDPLHWTLTAGEGGGEPVVEVPKFLYMSGICGDWTFDYYLKLYNEDNQTYGGVAPVNSEWGYKLYPEADNWDLFYTMVDGGNAYEGELVIGGEGNIAAPEAGLYLFDVNIGDLRYRVYPVNTVSYTGLNDDWTLRPMTATDVPGVYTAEVEKSANTPWGVKIVINDNWDLAFGGGSGELLLFRDGFDGDNDFDNGTLVLSVDLVKGTYTYTRK
ncbi:MAG: DUF5114 domain-containing protein [Muribaculaceae bacterium]|nr:DUF5114 domain-containing protein [Muribaculaceae bacterium]